MTERRRGAACLAVLNELDVKPNSSLLHRHRISLPLALRTHARRPARFSRVLAVAMAVR